MSASSQDYKVLHQALFAPMERALGDLTDVIEDIYGSKAVGYEDVENPENIPQGHFTSKAHYYSYINRHHLIHHAGDKSVDLLALILSERDAENNLDNFKAHIEDIADIFSNRFNFPELPNAIRQQTVEALHSAMGIIDAFCHKHNITFRTIPLSPEKLRQNATLTSILMPSYEELDALLVKALDIYLKKYGCDLSSRSDEAAETLGVLQSAHKQLEQSIKKKCTGEYTVIRSDFEGYGGRRHYVLADLNEIADHPDFAGIAEPLREATARLESRFKEASATFPKPERHI